MEKKLKVSLLALVLLSVAAAASVTVEKTTTVELKRGWRTLDLPATVTTVEGCERFVSGLLVDEVVKRYEGDMEFKCVLTRTYVAKFAPTR